MAFRRRRSFGGRSFGRRRSSFRRGRRGGRLRIGYRM